MQSGLALRSLAVIIVMLTAATAWAQTTNENETPMVSDQTFTLPEKQSGGKDWPAGKTVGKVATNAGTVPAGSYLTYKVTDQFGLTTAVDRTVTVKAAKKTGS